MILVIHGNAIAIVMMLLCLKYLKVATASLVAQFDLILADLADVETHKMVHDNEHQAAILWLQWLVMTHVCVAFCRFRISSSSPYLVVNSCEMNVDQLLSFVRLHGLAVTHKGKRRELHSKWMNCEWIVSELWMNCEWSEWIDWIESVYSIAAWKVETKGKVKRNRQGKRWKETNEKKGEQNKRSKRN